MKRLMRKIIYILIILLVLLSCVVFLQAHYKARAVNLLRKAFQSGEFEDIHYLLKNSRTSWISVLLTLLNDSDDQVKINTLTFIPYAKDRIKTVPKLISLLKNPNWKIRFFASQALGQIGDKRATEGLMQAWLNETQKDIHQENGNPWAVQREIALALAKIGDKRAVPTFLKTYQNESEEIQILSAIVLYKLGGDVVYLNALADAVHSKDYKIRAKVIWTLGDLGDQKIVPLLQDALDDTDPKIRDIAQKAIEKLKTRSNLNN